MAQDFAQRLRQWLDSNPGDTEAEKLRGLPQKTVWRWINRRSFPRKEQLDRLVSVSDLPASYWIDGKLEEPETDLDKSLVRVPILSATASAGFGAFNHEEGKVGELSFERAELVRLGASPKHLHLIKVEGDSMEPTIQHGRLVMIDTSKRRHGQDGIYAIRGGQGEEAEARIKRLRYGTNAGVEIISDNSIYPVERVPDRDEIKLIGRAIWTEKWL